MATSLTRVDNVVGELWKLLGLPLMNFVVVAVLFWAPVSTLLDSTHLFDKDTRYSRVVVGDRQLEVSYRALGAPHEDCKTPPEARKDKEGGDPPDPRSACDPKHYDTPQPVFERLSIGDARFKLLLKKTDDAPGTEAPGEPVGIMHLAADLLEGKALERLLARSDLTDLSFGVLVLSLSVLGAVMFVVFQVVRLFGLLLRAGAHFLCLRLGCERLALLSDACSGRMTHCPEPDKGARKLTLEQAVDRAEEAAVKEDDEVRRLFPAAGWKVNSTEFDHIGATLERLHAGNDLALGGDKGAPYRARHRGLVEKHGAMREVANLGAAYVGLSLLGFVISLVALKFFSALVIYPIALGASVAMVWIAVASGKAARIELAQCILSMSAAIRDKAGSGPDVGAGTEGAKTD